VQSIKQSVDKGDSSTQGATMATKGKVPKLTLGDRLRLAREHAGIGSQEMAEHFKCSRHTITNFEKGRTRPSHATLLEWARLTRYDLGWLMDGQIDYEDVAASRR
jgi:transcriptional regulator with XRE-family HTH domain